MERISQFLDFQGCLRPGEKTATEMRLSKGQIDEKTAFAEDPMKLKMFLCQVCCYNRVLGCACLNASSTSFVQSSMTC
jgi:hypothetical protein